MQREEEQSSRQNRGPSTRQSWKHWRTWRSRSLLGYVCALLVVALISLIIWPVFSAVPIANISMLYLIGVLAIAVGFGRGPAVVTALAAFLTFNWFFVEPIHTLTVADPSEWFALVLLLLTAVITGHLAAALRNRAREALAAQRETLVLYDVVRLMRDSDLNDALPAVSERLHAALGPVTIQIRLPSLAQAWLAAPSADPTALLPDSKAPSTDTQLLGDKGSIPANGTTSHLRWIRVVSPLRAQVRRTSDAGKASVVPIKLNDQRIGEMILTHQKGSAQLGERDQRLLSLAAAQIAIAFERNRLRKEATEADALRRTDELKTALLNSVSHDLRTPLSSIIAAASALRQHDVQWSEGTRDEFAADIEQEAQRLNRIVGNLLDLSRIEGNSLRPEMGLYDVASLIHDVTRRLRPLLAGRQLVVSVEENLPPTLLDYVEIDQVISNLIENAVKYTPPGSTIEIACRLMADDLQVEVSDNGTGIPASELPRLFQPFYRGDRKDTRTTGTGLGLAVAKGLVDAHNGRMWAENKPRGGARFAFTLPAGKQRSPDTAPGGHTE